MKPASASAIPLDMEQARQELEVWRSTHRPRCHIPDSLWKRRRSWRLSMLSPNRRQTFSYRITEGLPVSAHNPEVEGTSRHRSSP
jgi:hypothetical protein